MKNYSEERGVLSQTIYDANTGQFQQRRRTHGFESATGVTAKPIVIAEVVEFSKPLSASEDNAVSRKSRATVVQGVQNRHTG